MAQSARRDPTAQGDLSIRQQGRVGRLCRIRSIRASGTTTSVECAASDGAAGRARERRPAAPTAKWRAEARHASSATADRAARPKAGPAGPKVSRTPTPPPKAGKGALRRAHSGSPGLFWFGREIRRSCSRRRRERWGPLVWKEASCSGIRPWGFAVRAGRRMAGACDCDGRRQASFSVSGLARSGRPMPIPASCFRVDCRCRSSRRFRSRGCRLFRFRSAARHLWADRVPALTTAGEAVAGEAAAEASAAAAAATPTTR